MSGFGLPENLQIKAEQISPRKSPNNIKERLNLHLKRRLQQEQDLPSSATHVNINKSPGLATDETTAITIGSKRKEKQQKEPQKTKRPYQKRADKVRKTLLGSESCSGVGGGARQKNRRHKTKLLGATAAGDCSNQTNVSDESNIGGVGGYPPAQQHGEEDDGDGGGPEIETKGTSARDKEKCPDVLGVVLSMKKRALMQDPEVQQFFRKIMCAFKS